MEKLNLHINNGEALPNTFLNSIVGKVNELVDSAGLGNVFAMPQPVFDYLKTNNQLKSGTIGTYSATMTQAEITAWIAEYYS